MITGNKPQNERLGYVDALRGFSVLAIVLMHIHCIWELGTISMPWFILLPYYVPTFFFITGIFYKKESFQNLITHKFHTLILPFLSWYILSLVLFISFHLLKDSSFIPLQWNAKGVFGFWYPFTDGSLWFFPGLFCAICIVTILMRIHSRIIILLTSILLSGIGMLMMVHVIPRITSWLPISAIFWFQIFTIVGALYGKPLLALLEHGTRLQKSWLFASCLIYLLLINCLDMASVPFSHIPFMCWHSLGALSFICLGLAIFKILSPVKILFPFFQFYGKYSIVVFASHMLVYNYFYHDYFRTSTFTKFMFFGIFMLSQYLLIKFFQRFAPVFIAKNTSST